MSWLLSVDFVSGVFLPIALVIMMFSLGCSLVWQDFSRVVEQPSAILLGVTMQLLLLPLLAWVIIMVFSWFSPLPSLLAAGLIVLAVSPGGATSNIISHLVGGNSALSVSITALTSLLTPLLLPMSLMLQFSWLDLSASSHLQLPVMKTLLQLLVVSIIPVVCGILLRARFPSQVKGLEPRLRKISMRLFLVMILALVAVQWRGVVAMGPLVAVVCLLLAVFAIALGWGAGRLCGFDIATQKTLGIEVGIQNAGTGIFVAATLLADPQLALIPLTYGLVMNLPIAVLMFIYRQPQAINATGLSKP